MNVNPCWIGKEGGSLHQASRSKRNGMPELSVSRLVGTRPWSVAAEAQYVVHYYYSNYFVICTWRADRPKECRVRQRNTRRPAVHVGSMPSDPKPEMILVAFEPQIPEVNVTQRTCAHLRPYTDQQTCQSDVTHLVNVRLPRSDGNHLVNVRLPRSDGKLTRLHPKIDPVWVRNHDAEGSEGAFNEFPRREGCS
nr:hypothetical protein CFP56_57836 [Quercus suber]